MTRDVQSRIDLFTQRPGQVEVVRLALNMDQVEQYDPPPNPTKDTDSRSTGYVEQYGEDCWELDALDPIVIRDMIGAAIDERRNSAAWDEAVETERAHRLNLGLASERWEDVVDYLNNEASDVG